MRTEKELLALKEKQLQKLDEVKRQHHYYYFMQMNEQATVQMLEANKIFDRLALIDWMLGYEKKN